MWRKLLPIFIITFLIYLVVIYITPSLASNFDIQSYKDIGILTLAGKSIYPDPAISRHPYLPLFLYFEAVTQAASSFLKIPQIVLIKIILTLFHLVSIYALYLLSKKSLRTTILYALNPLSLLIIAFHGQFDIIPLTCLLLSLLTLQKKQYTKTILLLSLAITIKTWPILFIIPFLKRIPKKYYVYLFPLPIITLLSYSLMFHTSLFSLLRVLIVYQGVGGIWGLGKLLSLISASKTFLIVYKMIFVLGILLFSLRQKKQEIISELFQLFLFFFIFTPGFGLQWFLWLIPCLILSKNQFSTLMWIPLVTCVGISYLSWFPFFPITSDTIGIIFFLTWMLFIGYVGVGKLHFFVTNQL